MRVLMAFSFVFAAVVGACSQPNPDHCANKEGDLKGDAYCKSQSIDTPNCSRCIADNNGCVAEPVTDATCEVGSTSVGETSTSTPTTSTTAETITSGTSVTSTSDPVTSSPPTTTTTDPTTGDPSTTTTGDPSTTTTSTTTSDPSTESGTDTGTDSDSTTGETTDTSTDTTEGTTMGGPMCGDNLQEDPEICDGNDLNNINCVTKNPVKYGGGSLKCAMNCTAYDETMCCLAQDQACMPNQGQLCCPNTSCKLTLGLYKCKP